MVLVIVERTFEHAMDFPTVQELQRRGAWCYDLHGVTFLHTYLSVDGRHMVCVYEAPDAESVRRVQREVGMPFDHIWTGQRFP